MPTPPRGTRTLHQAFDELRFGRDNILNLRIALPTGVEAARRAELWLRDRQAAKAGEVLVITGRGRGSLDGIPVVRDAVVRLFPALRRAGVIVEAREHSPGSFVVRVAPLHALVEAPRRRGREGAAPQTPPSDPLTLATLEPDTRAVLRRLAVGSLRAVGLRHPSESFVGDEMLRQFGTLAALAAAAPDRDAALRRLFERALEEYEEK